MQHKTTNNHTGYELVMGPRDTDNPEYWQMMRHAYAAGQMVKEPRGGKASEHAEKINAGRWLELDLADAEFKRDMYKALRLGFITTKQMVTALLLSDAKRQFNPTTKGSIQQHKCSASKGPYFLTALSYIRKEHIDSFFDSLESLPESERCYFSIDCSRKFEATFLYDGITRSHPAFFNRYPKFNAFLIAYIERSVLSVKEKEYYLELVDALESGKCPPWNVPKLQRELQQMIEDTNPGLVQFFHTPQHKLRRPEEIKMRGSAYFMVDLLITNEQIPNLEISSNYDPNSPNSPLLCMILPPISVLNNLQLSVHGKDTVLPEFVVGKFGPGLIRDFDNREHPTRPVELTHPDVTSNPQPHERIVHDFILSWHDLYHAWWSGANMIKPFIRHLRESVLEEQKSYDMSKAIYALSDMDLSVGRIMREEWLKNPERTITPIHFYAVLLRMETQFWNALEAHDDNLLLVADMIINNDVWTELLGESPERMFSRPESIELDRNDYGSKFSAVYSRMKKIIAADPEKETRESCMFYILAYRLHDQRTGLELCRIIDKHIGLDTIFKWNRNSGLFLKKEYCDFEPRTIEKMSSAQLYKELNRIVDEAVSLEDNAELAASVRELRKKENMSFFQFFRHSHPHVCQYVNYSLFAAALAVNSYLVYSYMADDDKDMDLALTNNATRLG